MGNRKQLPLVIFLGIIALAMIGTSIYLLLGKDKTPTESKNNTDTITGTITNPMTGDKISFSIPDGWKQEYDSERDEYLVTSPDYTTEDSGVKNGVMMYLYVSGVQEGQTLETEKAILKQNTGFSDMTDVTIAKLSGIKYHSDWNGNVHAIQYFVINGEYSLLVSAFTRDLTAEQSYQSQIDSIINSISFK
jgi:hypothetical protein